MEVEEAAIRITVEEHGFPVELIGPAEVERAIAARRLRVDTIVRILEPNGSTTTCLARDAAPLQPLLGIDPASVRAALPAPAPPPPIPTVPAHAPAPPLRRGQNVAMSPTGPGGVRVTVGFDLDAAVPLDIDVSAFLLGPNGRVRGDGDIVFYNNDGHGGAVERHGAVDRPGLARAEAFLVRLDAVDAAVQRICFTASIHDAAARGHSFRHLHRAALEVSDASGRPFARYDFAEPSAEESALILGEFYRRGAEWKFRAVGQGYRGGLAALATSFGLAVSDPG